MRSVRLVSVASFRDEEQRFSQGNPLARQAASAGAEVGPTVWGARVPKPSLSVASLAERAGAWEVSSARLCSHQRSNP